MRTDLSICGTTLSEAWARTLVRLRYEQGHRACHVVTRIRDPGHEDLAIRAMVDQILAARGLAPVDTVRNTLFPEGLAHSTPEPDALGRRYLALLPTLKALDGENARGTYFERLVRYETRDGHLNQLAEVVRRLKVELAASAKPGGGAKTARYEISLEQLTASAPILQAERDTNPIGFPCLTMLSFQLDGDRIHAIAHYRSHYLIQRAYGNYLAVCRLLVYLAAQVGLKAGEVTVVAGYAQIDHYREATVDSLEMYLQNARLI